MSSDVFDFDEQLEMGTRWESDLSDRLESYLTRVKIENISYEEDPETQLSGIDAVLSEETPNIDTKVQDYGHRDTGNLPFETWSVEEEDIRGWFYTGDSDLIVWAYENRAGTNLLPRGYLMLKDTNLKLWFDAKKKDFRRWEVPNPGWTTVVRLVPIEEIPEDHLVEFDPRLPKDRDTPQSNLGDWE